MEETGLLNTLESYCEKKNTLMASMGFLGDCYVLQHLHMQLFVIHSANWEAYLVKILIFYDWWCEFVPFSHVQIIIEVFSSMLVY